MCVPAFAPHARPVRPRRPAWPNSLGDGASPHSTKTACARRQRGQSPGESSSRNPVNAVAAQLSQRTTADTMAPTPTWTSNGSAAAAMPLSTGNNPGPVSYRCFRRLHRRAAPILPIAPLAGRRAQPAKPQLRHFDAFWCVRITQSWIRGAQKQALGPGAKPAVLFLWRQK